MWITPAPGGRGVDAGRPADATQVRRGTAAPGGTGAARGVPSAPRALNRRANHHAHGCGRHASAVRPPGCVPGRARGRVARHLAPGAGPGRAERLAVVGGCPGAGATSRCSSGCGSAGRCSRLRGFSTGGVGSRRHGPPEHRLAGRPAHRWLRPAASSCPDPVLAGVSRAGGRRGAGRERPWSAWAWRGRRPSHRWPPNHAWCTRHFWCPTRPGSLTSGGPRWLGGCR